VKRIVAGLAAAAAILLGAPIAHAAQPAGRTVYEIDQTGTVDPLTARLFQRGVADAVKAGATAILVRIDTPGGLESSMRSIIQSILGSTVPVVCWVGPPGARAASAGAFILIGCPVAVMAPGTNVGAAHPVGVTGQVMDEKVTNDAAAFIRSLAQRWGRNADWAEQAVRQSVSISANEALRLKVVDMIATRQELFGALQGRAVKTADGTVTLFTDGLPSDVVTVRETVGEAVLHGLFDPDLAFLFFVFGIAGIVFEVLHPGVNIPGVAGLILLVAAFVIFGLLPVNIGGLLLIMAAIGFFVVDLKVAAHGIPTAAGVACLVVGGLILYRPSVPNAHVSRPLIVAIALGMAAFFFFAVRAALRARKRPALQTSGEILGREGVVTRDIAPTGVVRIGGEDWTAEAGGAAIPAGAKVRVVATYGLTARVEAVEGVKAGRGVRRKGTEVS